MILWFKFIKISNDWVGGYMNKIIKNIIFSVSPKKIFIARGSRQCHKVFLTFDDGPNKEFTEDILDILLDHKVKATFFVIGRKAEENPIILKRIFKEGHEIGNHTYNHTRGRLGWKQFEEEIFKTQRAVKGIIGCSPRLFRFPYGEINLSHLCLTFSRRLTSVFWSIDTNDYQAKNSDEFLENFEKLSIKSGDILLLHDNGNAIVESLPEILTKIKKSGCDFARVGELL